MTHLTTTLTALAAVLFIAPARAQTPTTRDSTLRRDTTLVGQHRAARDTACTLTDSTCVQTDTARGSIEDTLPRRDTLNVDSLRSDTLPSDTLSPTPTTPPGRTPTTPNPTVPPTNPPGTPPTNPPQPTTPPTTSTTPPPSTPTSSPPSW